MEAETTTESPIVNKDKKQVDRSAAYPASTISEVKELVTKIYKVYPVISSVIKKDDIVAIAPSGYIARDISTAVQYGLLEKIIGEGYKITPLFKRIYAPYGDDARLALLEAFKNPKLYQNLIQKFDGHAVPKELPLVLFRFHEIAEKASKSAADVFVRNATEIGLLNEHGILNCSTEILPTITQQGASAINEQNSSVGEITNVVIKQNTPTEEKGISQSEPLRLQEIADGEKERIRLTENKFALITYPKNLTAKDILILKKWIELVELTIA